MSYVNNYQCCGRLVAEPRLDRTGRAPRVNFTLALNKPGAPHPFYIDCVAWGERALHLADSCSRGTEVNLSGELETSTFCDARGSWHKATCLVIERFSVISSSVRLGIRVPRPRLPE